MAELGPDHDRNSCNLDLVIFKQGLFRDHGGDAGFLVFFAILDLFNFDCAEQLCLVGQTSDSGLVRKDVVVEAVALVLARVLVHSHTAKDDLVSRLFVIRPVVLPLDLDFVFFELLDDLLD